MKRVFEIKKSNLYQKKQFQNLYCPDPFETVNIDDQGNVSLCGCENWHPHKIGNIFEESLAQIYNNNLAKQIRESIRDGTYVYCNEKTCGPINNNTLIPFENLIPELQDKFSKETYFEMPYTYYIAGDPTCNLSCPSCRTGIIDKNKLHLLKNEKVLNILNEQIFNSSSDHKIIIKLSTSGEVFASNILLEFCSKFNLENYPLAEFWIQSNGLLIKNRWHKIEHLGSNIKNFTITADSCTKNNYEKLRRGGKFEKLIENLKFLQQKKQQLNFTFIIRMVVQYDNHSELEEFYDFAKSFDADSLEYVRITNWGTYTTKQFEMIDVLNPNHHLYQSVSQTIKKLSQYTDVKVYGYELN